MSAVCRLVRCFASSDYRLLAAEYLAPHAAAAACDLPALALALEVNDKAGLDRVLVKYNKRLGLGSVGPKKDDSPPTYEESLKLTV